MPVAIVQDWVEEETDRSTTNYDAISERIMARDEVPKGLLVHAAGFTGSGFRIFEVWESQEAFDRFAEDVLMPILQESRPTPDQQPRVTAYELHGYIAAPG